MSCLENFLNKPVIIQLGEPLAAAHSVSEKILDENDENGEPMVCGVAVMSEVLVFDQQGNTVINPQTGEPVTQPVAVQILKGEISAVSDDGLIFSTVGGDGKTPVLVFLPKENVRGVTFALEHVEQEVAPPKPLIVVPN